MFDILQTDTFSTWLRGLPLPARKKVVTRISNMELGNFGDCAPVGGNVSETKIHAGAGYRLYFMRHGATVYLLLVGGNKASQERDIRKAKSMARALSASE